MMGRVRAYRSSMAQQAIVSFLELGNERNRLVHQDYATFQMEKTLEKEVYELYRQALTFVESLPTAMKDIDAKPKQDKGGEAQQA